MYYYISCFIFAVIAYLVLTDQSVITAFYYIMKLIKIEYQKRKWILLNDPRNPIVKYMLYRRSYKLAKELQRQFEENDK